MSKNLVIVESPAKAKTIERFLGDDYHVLSSQGHIRDIEPLGKNSMGIDFEHGYAPNYVVDPKKHHLVDTLKAEVKKAAAVAEKRAAAAAALAAAAQEAAQEAAAAEAEAQEA